MKINLISPKNVEAFSNSAELVFNKTQRFISCQRTNYIHIYSIHMSILSGSIN